MTFGFLTKLFKGHKGCIGGNQIIGLWCPKKLVFQVHSKFLSTIEKSSIWILAVNPFKIREIEMRANEAEAALEELKQEFEEYKRDKAENDKIALEMYEQVFEKMNVFR